MPEQSYLLFLSKATGYELREEAGDAPSAGSEIEVDDETLRITKVGPSPLPGDGRRCAYSQSA